MFASKQRSLFDILDRERLAGQECRRDVGCEGVVGGSGDANRSFRSQAVFLTDGDRDTDDGITARGMADFAISELHAWPRPRNMNGYEHVPGLERGGHDAEKELPGPNAPPAIGTRQLQLGVQRDDDGRPIGRRVGIRQRATNGAAVAHLRITSAV